MVETTVIKTRRDSTANRETQNPALAEGEFGVEILASGEKKIKIGDGTTARNDLGYATKTPIEIDEEITEKLGELQTIIQEALDTKANIYIRQAQGITYGNNIQGMHIIVPEDFVYTTDWEWGTADDQHFIRTDNDFKYVDSNGTETYIIQNGEIVNDDCVIVNPFVITTMTGNFNDEAFFYRYFDIKDLDQRIGLVSSLLTADKSSIVNAINSLKQYVDDIVQSTEVENSPYASYSAFLADAGVTIQPGKYAYVTFLSTDNRPSGGNWDKIVADETRRLDCSSIEWSPITNMTASQSANLTDASATDTLKQAGNDLIVNRLQSFRNNLKSLLNSIKNKVDKKTTDGDYVYIHNGNTQGEKAYTLAPTASTLAERTTTGTLRGTTATDENDLVNLAQFEDGLEGKVDKVKGKGLSLINYSSGEQDTGRKRIDGKTIYMRVFTGNIVVAANTFIEPVLKH